MGQPCCKRKNGPVMNQNLKTNKDFIEVLKIIRSGRAKTFHAVNTNIIETYWNVGGYLSRKVSEAKWGKGVVRELSEWIIIQDPDIKGFSASNLWRMRQFYDIYRGYEILAPLVRELSWSHNLIILGQCRTMEEKEFYLRSAVKNRWGKRELDKQISRSSFDRTLLADKKLSPVMKSLPQDVTGTFKDVYFVDYLNLPENHHESDFQKALLQNLRQFLMELGNNFTFVGEKVRLQVGNQDFELDLLFYHRQLQCLCAFELKTVKFKPEHLGQLSFYLEALDQQHKLPHENPSIGILLCRGKDDEVVRFALNRHLSPALVADYETKLIPREFLQQKLHEWSELIESKTEGNKV